MPRRVPSSVLGVGSRNTQCKDLTVSALMVFAVGMSATAAAALHPVALHHHCSSLTHWQLLDGFITAPRSCCSGCGSQRFLPAARVMPAPAAVLPQRRPWDSLVLPEGWGAELDFPAVVMPQCVYVPVVASGVSLPAAGELPAPAAVLPQRHPWDSLVLPVGWRAELDSPAQHCAPALPQRLPWDALLLPEGWRAELDAPALGKNTLAPAVMPF